MFNRTLIKSYEKTALCAQNSKSLPGKISLRFYDLQATFIALYESAIKAGDLTSRFLVFQRAQNLINQKNGNFLRQIDPKILEYVFFL